jgi:hypothetical protein
MQLKEQFSNWINEELKLTLSQEKTKVTDLINDKAKFLGYQISFGSKHKKYARISRIKKFKPNKVLRRIKISYYSSQQRPTFKQRATNPSAIIAWDRDRVITRLEEKRFIRKYLNNWRGCSKKEWTTLELPEIIQKYNYIIRGYIQYYAPVTTYATDIHQLHYLLKYSCAHTIANKLNTSLKDVFKKYSKDIIVNYSEKVTKRQRNKPDSIVEIQKTSALITWKDCLQIINSAITQYRKNLYDTSNENISIQTSVDDICNVKVNWRTKYKLSKHCSICGSEQDVEYHHVKHIKIGKVTGFLQIMKQLNRRQIPCCKFCHRKIHKGEYNGISLDDLYDEELIIL